MKTGTREWSEHSFNCVKGCDHACLYCYARAGRFNPKRGADWANEELTMPKVRKYTGIVMFPTQHDFTENNIFHCLSYLTDLMDKGNQVLIVTKAAMPIVGEIVNKLLRYPRELSEIRFTTSHVNPDVGRLWEPGAPPSHERTLALAHAFQKHIRTSVSCEPWLDSIPALKGFVDVATDYVTETIWIGHANWLWSRTNWCRVAGSGFTPDSLYDIKQAIAEIEARQTPEVARQVFDKLKGNPKIRWKDSYKKMLGLAEEAGQ